MTTSLPTLPKGAMPPPSSSTPILHSSSPKDAQFRSGSTSRQSNSYTKPPDTPPATSDQRLLAHDSENEDVDREGSDKNVQFATFPASEKRKTWDPVAKKAVSGGTAFPEPWTPLPLRKRFWIPFIILLVLLGIGLEIAFHYSVKNNGFKIKNGQDGSTQGGTGVWHYVYTLPPVALSMFIVALWAWTDIEIKKMQPYVDLIHGNSPPQRSLLLDYTRQNNFLVWVQALSNRHYTVFLTTLMVLTSLSFQPLSAALLEVRDTWWSVPNQQVNLLTTPGLNLANAEGDLTTFLAGAGYAAASVTGDVKVPRNTFGQYAIADFNPPALTRNGTTLNFNTTAVKTNTGCQTVNVQMTQSPTGNGSWTNVVEREGCGLTWTVDRTGPNLFGATAAICNSATNPTLGNKPIQFHPVVFWFFTYVPKALSSATICYPTIQLFDVGVSMDFGSGNITNIREIKGLDSSESNAAEFKNLTDMITAGNAFNGIDWDASVSSNDSTIAQRKSAIQLTMPAAIFQAAVNQFGAAGRDTDQANGGGVDAAFSSDRFVGLSSGVYQSYLTLLAKSIYFIPTSSGASQIPIAAKTTIKRLFLTSAATHLLAAALFTVAFTALLVHLVHIHDRKLLRLHHQPGTIASSLSIGGQTALAELLAQEREGREGGEQDMREEEMRELLRNRKFRIDPENMKIVMEGETGYEAANSPGFVGGEGAGKEGWDRRKSVMNYLAKGGRRLSVLERKS